MIVHHERFFREIDFVSDITSEELVDGFGLTHFLNTQQLTEEYFQEAPSLLQLGEGVQLLGEQRPRLFEWEVWKARILWKEFFYPLLKDTEVVEPSKDLHFPWWMGEPSLNKDQVGDEKFPTF
jgi:hypothetical protein